MASTVSFAGMALSFSAVPAIPAGVIIPMHQMSPGSGERVPNNFYEDY